MIIATILITAFVGVLLGFGAAYVHMQLKNAKTPMDKEFPVHTVTIKEIRGSDRIEEEYEAQKCVVNASNDDWHENYRKTYPSWKGSLRDSVEAGVREKMLWEIYKREAKKLEELKKEFEKAISREIKPSRPHKGISLEQILAIPRCGGYDDDHIRKLFGNRHYVIPQTIVDADIPAEDKLWALFHLMGDNKRHRLALEAGARANILWLGHSGIISVLWDIVRSARHKICTVYGVSNPHDYWEELQWQLKRAMELMEEKDE